MHTRWPQAAEPLEFLAMIALQSGQIDQSVKYFQQLVKRFPDKPLYCDRLASLLVRLGRTNEALSHYRSLLGAHPEFVVSRFNYAGLLRSNGQNEAALTAYDQCLDKGIEHPEEVLSTMGSILADLNRNEEAEQVLNRALGLNSAYAPAHYNLALYHEECGNWPRAREQFEQIPPGNPLHFRALARMAHGETIADQDSPLLQQLASALGDENIKPDLREELHFALAKGFDDCGQYQQAFAQCDLANGYAAKRTPAYDTSAEQALVTNIIAKDQDPGWSNINMVSQRPLVFVCGMFRSGSTLLEQMLGAHPALIAGGEIDFFARQLATQAAVDGISNRQAIELGQAYLDQLDAQYGNDCRVIDKRLDNSYYIGLLLRMFPRAKFLLTVRHPLDNALSIYFQQLASGFSYANQLIDIGDYFLQQQRLLDHWLACYPDSVSRVHYEALVTEPRATLEPVLESLGLEWSDTCLSFHNQQARVRTASVAQVRKPLYTASIGRWQHYEQQLKPLMDYLDAVSGARDF